MDCSLNWSYINYGDKNCVVTLEERQKNLDWKGNLTGGCHFSNYRHICGDNFALCRVPGFPEWKWKFMRDCRKLSFLSPVPCCRVSSRVQLTHVLFTIPPEWGACLQATKEIIIDPNHSTFYIISMECQFSVIEAQISGPSVALFWSAVIVKWMCKTFLILFRSKINK